MAMLFVPDAVRLLAVILEAVDAGDAERLRQEAHALKGAAGNFGATAVVAAAFELELMGKSGDLSTSKAVFAGLSRDTGQLIHALQLFGEVPACAS
jgi:HPt (histidine-containing phosphotransfer) domain-containing protein